MAGRFRPLGGALAAALVVGVLWSDAFAYHAGELDPNECFPEAGSVAQLGPTSGSMLLFRLPLQNTEYRPLELEIQGEGDEHLTFELDI